MAFYQRDKENLQRFPQNYGLQGKLSNISSRSKEEQKSHRSSGDAEFAPDESRLR
jgi:hypothetical protein